MYLDKDKILNSLTNEDVTKICIELGSQAPRNDGQGNLIFQTICHGGDSYKLYYYTESKKFHCYTGCSESFDVINLVIRANKTKGKVITWYNALKWIGLITGKLSTIDKTITEDRSYIIPDQPWRRNIRKNSNRQKTIPELKEYNEHILELFDYTPVQEWLKEGITPEVLSEFEIGYYYLQDCITIPVRDINGRFIGLRARYLREEDIEKGKYRPMVIEGESLKYNTGRTLYGIYQNQKAIRKYKKAFLFESEKSVLLNHSYFEDEDLSLAVCGSNIKETQIKILIKQLGITHLVVCFDKEYDRADSYEAEIYYNKLLKKVEPLIKLCKVELVLDRQDLLNKKDSPVDQGLEVWSKLLEDKILVTMEDIRAAKGR